MTSRGTPQLGYCLQCLNAMRREFEGLPARKDVRVFGDPDHPEGAEVFYAAHPGAAIDAWERGALVSVGGLSLRMRADVTAPEPACADHYGRRW